MWEMFTLVLSLLLSSVCVAVGDPSPGMPDVLDYVDNTPSHAIALALLNFPPVELNAALSANLSINASAETTQCDQTFNVTGSLQCLKNYYAISNAVRPRNKIVRYDTFDQCEAYEIAFICVNDTNTSLASPDVNSVTSDVSVLLDGAYDMAWAHRVDSGSPVTFTLDLATTFTVYAMILVVETIPVEVIISGYQDGELKTYFPQTFKLHNGELDGTEYTPIERIRFPVVYLDMVKYGDDPKDDVFQTLDKLTLTLTGESSWMEYNINYYIIREIYIESTCACTNGDCSAIIDDNSEISKLARHSCICPADSGLAGFLCDICADGYYNYTGKTCSPCDCGYGAQGCDPVNGTCICNEELYYSQGDWDPKCEESIVSEVTPSSGVEFGGTRITIRGGLLTQLTLTNCDAVDGEQGDTLIICSVHAGTKYTSVPLLTTKDGTILYNFTYTENYEITDVFPTEAFASGGRALTVIGNHLDEAKQIIQIYKFTCVLNPSESWQANSSCVAISSSEAQCESLDFCNVDNLCTEKGVSERFLCLNRNTNSIGDTIKSVNISLSVKIYDVMEVSVPNSAISLQFDVRKDPDIFLWENSLRMIQSGSTEFEVPGQNLDSGAVHTDYTVSIDGVLVQPTGLSGTRLTVQWPSSRPLGSTNVSVGSLSRNVGVLTFDDVKPKPPVRAIAISVSVVVVVMIVIAVVAILWRRKVAQSIAKDPYKNAYKPGNVRYITRSGGQAFIPLGHLIPDEHLADEIKPFLIDKERLSLSTQLGSGQFGKVFKGTVQFDDGKRTITVAAKTLKADTGVTEEIVNNFLKEATLMSNFNHPNVLSLIGVVYGEANMPIVVLPFMHHGDIKHLINSDEEVLVLGDLLHFAMQIARGMEYLAGNRFIHRDLAARNCMVDNEYVVKIADFGLSHDIYEDDYYRTDETSSKPLPVKWMALESLNTGRFTTHSDVWSYGVVMWELLTRGITPYPTVSNYEIKTHLKSGERLSQPQYCPDIIYEMMQSCWQSEPTSRPTFTELADKIASILEESNYVSRSKTKQIESDYYLQPTSNDDFSELFIQVVE